ncbi:MAG TPA: hypothetical protein VN644_02670 [Pyrinomonadaceae bacterium]|jgi:hypothetical protein|nr:hypothetical protein [Pyrinomonadaceae bacterium]
MTIDLSFGAVLTQLGLLFFTGLGIFLVNRPESWPRRRWGFLLALLGQGIWFYLSLKDGNVQFGMFILNVFCTVGWAQGFWNNFLKRQENPEVLNAATPRDVTSGSTRGSVHQTLGVVDP